MQQSTLTAILQRLVRVQENVHAEQHLAVLWDTTMQVQHVLVQPNAQDVELLLGVLWDMHIIKAMKHHIHIKFIRNVAGVEHTITRVQQPQCQHVVLV